MFRMHNDQAAGLRAMKTNNLNHEDVNSDMLDANMKKESINTPKNKLGKRTKPVRVIAVASGKGGVGKTNVSVNLAVALTKLGNRVLLMDADMGLANVDIMLGLQAKYNLSHVLSGEKSLVEVMADAPGGFKIIPATSGDSRMAQLTLAENSGIINAFSEIDGFLDVLIIDTAAGIADSVISYCRASQEVVVVVTDEPASMTDAYALIKVLSREHHLTKFQLMANMTRTTKHGQELHKKFAKVCENFLDVAVDYLGTIPFDHDLKEAIQKQAPVMLIKPNSESAKAFKAAANRINQWPIPTNATGYLQFFIENLFQYQRN